MYSTLWKKAWRDLWLRKLRTCLVIGAIAASTFTLGTVLVSFHLLERDMNASYSGANPHHISLSVSPASQVDDDLLEALTGLTGIEAVDGRYVISGRIQNAKGHWHPLYLFSARDFSQVKVDIMTQESGPWPPKPGQMSIERQALSVLGGGIGEKVRIELNNGMASSFEIGGLVHDVVLAQAEWENVVYAYIGFDSLQQLGIAPHPNQIKIALSASPDEAQVKAQVQVLKDWFEAKGMAINEIDIADPGGHPHHEITSEMFLIMEIFAWFCCIFSSILVVNMLTSSLAMEKRQIGVMKAMGAHASQITHIYFASVIWLGSLALAISLPFIVPAGLAMAEYFAKMMNFDIENAVVPLWIFAVQLGLGIGLPLLTCYWPIRLASKRSIRASLVDYGLGNQPFRTRVLDRLFSSWLSAPQLISIRSTFRRKGRLILNIGVLSSAAAFMIASFNLDATISAFVKSLNQTNRWDLRVNLADPIGMETLPSISHLPEVKAASAFFHVKAHLETAPDQHMSLIGVDPGSQMLRLPLLKGEQLSGDPDEVLISQSLTKFLANSNIGDQIKIASSLGDRHFRIIGIVTTIGRPQAYVNADVFTSAQGDKTWRLFVTAKTSPLQAKQALSKYFEGRKTAIASISTPEASINSVIDHFEIIFNLILLLAVLVGIIGINGIFSSMGTSLMERSREFGILKAIGASKAVLLRIIIYEAIFMGLVGWILATWIALPMSKAIAHQMGMILLQAPLPLALSLAGLVASLVLVPAMSVLGCLVPAMKCVNRPVRDSLTYE